MSIDEKHYRAIHPTGGTMLFGLSDVDGFSHIMMDNGFQSLRDCLVDRFCGMYSALDKSPICEGDILTIRGYQYGVRYSDLKWWLQPLENAAPAQEMSAVIISRMSGNWHNMALTTPAPGQRG